jgi:hypothetical protein
MYPSTTSGSLFHGFIRLESTSADFTPLHTAMAISCRMGEYQSARFRALPLHFNQEIISSLQSALSDFMPVFALLHLYGNVSRTLSAQPGLSLSPWGG